MHSNNHQMDQTYKLNALYIAFCGNWIPRFVKIPFESFWLKAFYKETYNEPINDFKIGLSSGLFYICMAIAALSIGPLSSKYGRRPTILICLIGLSICLSAQAFAQTFTILLIFKSLQGAFVATVGLYQSYIVDVCNTEDIIKYSSRLFLMLGIICSILPPISGLMTSGFDALFKNSSFYSESLQYRCSHIVASFIAFFVFVYCFFQLQESVTIKVNEITDTEKTTDSYKDNTAETKTKNELDAIYENMLPQEYKTKEFKQRLWKYLIILLIATILLEMCIVAHHMLYPILVQDTLEWTHIHHSVNLFLFGGSMALSQVFYPKKMRLLTIASICSAGMIVSYISIPVMNMICLTYFRESSKWMQLLLHLHISVLAGAGYGIISTVLATIFSDLAKKYNHKHVDNWLAAWSCSASFGCFLVVPQTFLSTMIKIPKTIYFVNVPGSVVLFGCLMYLCFATKDISIATDMNKVIEEDKKLGEKDVEAGDIDSSHIYEIQRASRQSINKFMFGINSHSTLTDIVSPAMFQGIPMTTESATVSVRSSKKDLSVVIPTGNDIDAEEIVKDDVIM